MSKVANPVLTLIVLSDVLLAGCSYTIRVPSYSLLPPVPASHFIAGVGKAELTPPPGIPLGGHGPSGRVARGHWTRLYARAFYFQDVDNHVLTLVSCDLFSLPAGLRAQVLEIVNRNYRLEDASLIMSATHTHHGPANFSSAPLYNAFAGPLPHFERRLFDFLADQIAKSITQAIVDARGASAERHTFEVYKGAAVRVQRNRAIVPFFRNLTAVRESIMQDAQQLGAMCPDGTVTDCPRYFAVDPTLIVVKILRDGSTHGLMTFYAVHPTAMTHDAELYSGDIAGVAMLMLEKNGHGVSGFFNGAEGDVSPDWVLQDRDDVLEFGKRLSTAVNALLMTSPLRQTDNPSLDTRWSRVRYNASCGSAMFAKKPMAGAAELGGAEDGRTIFYNYGWRPEARKGPDTDDDVKEPGLDRPLADALTSLDGDALAGIVRVVRPTHFVSAKDFPQEIPVAVAHLGEVLDLATVPTEVTTAVGWAIRAVLAGGGRPIAVVGLANEYVGYTTTREEYQLQQYEGASTLLGPGEADMLVCLIHGAQTLPTPDHVPEAMFRAGPTRKYPFGPDTLLVTRPRNMVDEDLEPLIPRRLRRLESRIPRFEWSEERSEDWAVPLRSVCIVVHRAGTSSWEEFDNDRGVNFLTILVDGGPPGRGGKKFRRYAALWLPPEHLAGSDEFAFRVQTPSGAVRCSQGFRVGVANPATVPVAPIPPALCQGP